MILWTLERVNRARLVSEVIVATDNADIAEVVLRAGGTIRMTSPDLASGTDRVAAACQTIDASIIVNVQGDEPLIDPEHIDLAITALLEDSQSSMATLAASIRNHCDLLNENIVKVLINELGHAIYFSRMPVPYIGKLSPFTPHDIPNFFRHIGLYVYRKSFLFDFADHSQTFSERIERLEQLRALDMGARIAVRCVESVAPSIDTPEDVNKVEALLRRC